MTGPLFPPDEDTRPGTPNVLAELRHLNQRLTLLLPELEEELREGRKFRAETERRLAALEAKVGV